ncbi:glutathione S-transferase N-terminal domain-containing protein [Robbsia andropogonis]|uniref:glutathione S-transferase N-terminal domain-containing protein n=1 Tax=Robbsia andropogonis TaxID=28092 RepID=UPI003D1E2437
MLKIHHLGHSQSERILWLCEELDVPYEIEKYTRDPITRLSPPELKALHPLGCITAVGNQRPDTCGVGCNRRVYSG